MIEIADDQGPTRHGASRTRLGERSVERPVPRPIAEVHLDTGISISEQDQVRMTITVEIRELGPHISVLFLKNLSRVPSPPVAEQGLDASEMAGDYDVREPVAVDVPRGDSAVADIGPGGRHRAEAASTVAEPDVEGRVDEPGRRDEIEVAVPIEIDKEGLKPPLLPLSQGKSQ